MINRISAADGNFDRETLTPLTARPRYIVSQSTINQLIRERDEARAACESLAETNALIAKQRDEAIRERESLYPVLDEKSRVMERYRTDLINAHAQLATANVRIAELEADLHEAHRQLMTSDVVEAAAPLDAKPLDELLTLNLSDPKVVEAIAGKSRKSNLQAALDR